MGYCCGEISLFIIKNGGCDGSLKCNPQPEISGACQCRGGRRNQKMLPARHTVVEGLSRGHRIDDAAGSENRLSLSKKEMQTSTASLYGSVAPVPFPHRTCCTVMSVPTYVESEEGFECLFA